MNAIPEALPESWTEPTAVLPLSERPIYRKLSEPVVFFSRFPDEEVDPPIPPAPDLVSIHDHALEFGRLLVFEWGWDDEEETWRQLAVVNVPSIENAREYVPPKFERVEVPESFGIEAWRAR
jgi:hypothetical protein